MYVYVETGWGMDDMLFVCVCEIDVFVLPLFKYRAGLPKDGKFFFLNSITMLL